MRDSGCLEVKARSRRKVSNPVIQVVQDIVPFLYTLGAILRRGVLNENRRRPLRRADERVKAG